MSNNILVTGGFGFVGGHLVDYLTKTRPDDHVHVVDSLSTSPIPHKHLLGELGNRPNLTYDTMTVSEYFRTKDDKRWDQIYHLASVVGPAGVLQHAGEIVRSVTEDTYLLIEIALRDNARLLDVSTSEIYGGGQEGYCSESFPKIIPPKTTIRLEYAVAKLAAETALINTSVVKPLDTVIIRPFNISGPRQSGAGGFVLPRFVGFAIENQPITVFGKGDQIRAFTHVEDIVSGLVLAMEHGKSGEAYNIGNPMNKISIGELASRVIALTNSKSETLMVDPQTIYGPLYEEANDKYPDARRAMRELGWKPKFSVEDIILDTYEYMTGLDDDVFKILHPSSCGVATERDGSSPKRQGDVAVASSVNSVTSTRRGG